MYRRKLTLVFAGFLCFALTLAGAIYWGAGRAQYLQDRSRHAHDQLETYLSLSLEMHQLYQQVTDSMKAGQLSPLDGVSRSEERLGQLLGRVRSLIEQEVALLEDEADRREESDELIRLAAIGEEIRSTLRQLQELEQLRSAGRSQDVARQLATIVDPRFGDQVTRLIRTEIEAERREMEGADLALMRLLSELTLFSQITAIVAVLLAVAGGAFCLRRLSTPVASLSTGAQRLAAGDLDHRIVIHGDREFAEVADSVNRMARDLASERAELMTTRDRLGETVRARTEELRRANAALTRADLDRRRFFADISHELRTPLTVIRGEAEVTLRGREKSPSEYQAALARIVDQVADVSRVVDDLLWIARSGSGAMRLEAEPVPLSDVIASVYEDALVLARQKGIELSLEAAEDDLRLTGDPFRLRQLFMILLDNAISYSRRGDRVTVQAKEEGGMTAVRVTDTGTGIPASELDSVFDRFVRGRTARKLSPQGSGLGLPLAKSIAEAHGGSIALHSARDLGTVVTVKLPADPAIKARARA